MELTAYQIITPLAGFVAVAYAWNLVFRQKKTLWEAILWTIFWGSIITISLYPDALDYLSKFTGIKDRENAVLVTTIAVLLFIVFYLIVRIESLEQRQTRVIRKLALKDLDKKSGKN
jgi:hypothetical protein